MVMERSGNCKNIGVYGGTFNPIHYGHLINIEFIRDAFSLDKVLFIPTKSPVHKPAYNIDPYDRLNMVKLAIDDNPYFDASAIEIDRDSPSYTITTINDLKKKFISDKLHLIIGSDSFNELDSWKSYRELLSEISLIVIKRPGSETLREDILNITKEIKICENPLIDISSSMIRDRIQNGKSIKYLTPDSVINYIQKKGAI